MISLAKQQLLGPDDDLAPVAGEDGPALSSAYNAYQAFCKENGTADFEDLIFMAHQALVRDPVLLERIQNRFGHVFVDEYQDLNFGQYELVKLLAARARILVIGDPDQSIYGFRGSDNRFFKRFPKDFPGCKQVRLSRNYRSTQTILDASFQMISKSDDQAGDARRIFSSLDTAQKLMIRETPTQGAEAVAVGKMIEGLVGGLSLLSMDTGGNRSEGLGGEKEYSFSDFAVLYRTRAQCEVFAAAFEKAGIPFQTADREKWQAMAGIRETLDLLGLAAGCPLPEDRQARIPEDLAAAASVAALDPDSKGLVKAIGRLLEMEKRIEDDPELGSAWGRLILLAGAFPSPRDLVDRLALDRDADLLLPGAEKVSLMTIHAAKGLEFPVVFVTGCEQGLIPFARDGRNVGDVEEERRLFYVAMTRAMDILCLTYAKKRRIFGLDKSRVRSCFIEDIEKRLARYEKGTGRREKIKKEVQLELF